MGPRLLHRSDARDRLLAVLTCAIVMALLAGCSLSAPPGAGPLRYRDAVFPNITQTSNLQYGSAPDLNGNPVALMLDLYQPTGDTVAARPAIVWVHGGGYCCGDKSAGPSANLAQEFAHYGYVTVSINYRLLAPNGCSAGNGVVSPTCYTAALAAQNDAQAAVRWLRANASTYRIDPYEIGIGGDSAGAITASLVGLDPQDPGNSGNPGYSSQVQAFMSLSGGTPNGLFASAGDAPGLLFSGTADPTVPFAWSAETAADLLNDGVPAILEAWPGAGHDPYAQFKTQIDSQSDYFFYDFLDAANAQGSTHAQGLAFQRYAQTMSRKHPAFGRALERAMARQHRPPRWLGPIERHLSARR
jgi:para-nitrobenzyl esterase